MRLIHGKIHDYYDVVAKHGHSTEGNTYLRNTEDIKFECERQYTAQKGWQYSTGNHPLSFLIADSINLRNNPYRFKDKTLCEITTFKILFCGKVYRGIKIVVGMYPYYCYTVDEVNAVFKNYDSILPEKLLDKRRTVYGLRNLSSEEFLNVESLNKYFTVKDYSDICIANKYVIASWFGDTHCSSFIIKLNCRLQDYEFYRVFDPYSAYQELSMYVDGMLAYPGNIVTDIPDEYKIESKGFDKKYGFRTRPKSD
jgi:hypothetical protein